MYQISFRLQKKLLAEMQSIEEAIWRYAKKNPDKIAVKSGKEEITYSELFSRILRAKTILESLPDFTIGNSIVISATKQLEFLYVYFGAHLAGLRVSLIDKEANPFRLKQILDTVMPFCIVGFNGFEVDFQNLSFKEFIYHSDVELATIEDQIEFPKQDAIADVLFTTGTTGNPKCVPLTFKNESVAARNINTYIQNKETDIELVALPISHSFGLGRIRCCLSNGQTLILLSSFVNTKRLFRIIEEEKVTGFSMVPASWKFLQKMSGDKLADYSSQIKYIEMGSSSLSEEDKLHLANIFPSTRVTMHYGLTEASRSAFMEFHEDKEHFSSIGKASPNTDIKVFSVNGEELPHNQEGEICIKGDHVTSGYLYSNNEDSFYGEYFRTGDSGIIDEKGYVYLKSRIKELINVGGKKVAPSEIDEQIKRIDGVDDCACIGVKDPEGVMGEVVKAFIVKHSGSNITFDFIKTYLVEKLESYKIPVEFEWIESIPRTSNGKIRRNVLKTNL